MPNKPTTVPQLDTNQTNRTIPAPTKVSDGYLTDDVFPAANANYLHGWTGDWLGWLDATFEDGDAAGDLRINGIVGLEDTPLTGWKAQKFNIQHDADGTANEQGFSVGMDINALTANRSFGAVQSYVMNHDSVGTYSVSWEGNYWAEIGLDNAGLVGDAECYSGYVAAKHASGRISGVAAVFRAYDGDGTGTIDDLYGLRVDALTAGVANWGIWVGNCNPGYSIWVDGGTVALGPGLMTHRDSGTFTGWDTEQGWKSISQSAHAATADNYAYLFETNLTSTDATRNFGGIIVGHYCSHNANATNWTPGVWSEVALLSGASGNINQAEAFGCGVYNRGSGTIGIGAGLRVYDGLNDGGGTFTNQYGVRIENLTAAANNYGVYVEGASTYAIWVDAGLSRFDGNVGAQVESPTYPIHVYANQTDTVGDGFMAVRSGTGAGTNMWSWRVDTGNGYLFLERDWSGKHTVAAFSRSNGRLKLGNDVASGPRAPLHIWESDVNSPAGETQLLLEKNDSLVVNLLSSNAAGKLAGFWFGDADTTALGRFEYYHDVDRMDWWTANVRHMVLLNNGWLGIGNNFTDPDARLHVQAGSSGQNPVSGTVACLEHSSDAYLSILTPAANMGGLICGDPGDSDAGRFVYDHNASPPCWDWWVEGIQQMKLDLTNGLVVNDPVKATTYASSETGRILQTDFLDAVVEPENPTTINRLGSTFRLQIQHSATVTAYKHLPMPASGTVTAARIKLAGNATHNFIVRLYKKDKDSNIGTNGTLVAEADYSGTPLDISAAAGTWVTLTMNSGSFDNDGSVIAEVSNYETGVTLTIGFLELTTTLGDVTISKL